MGGQNHQLALAIETGQRHRRVSEQARRFDGNRGEDVLRRRCLRDELGDRAEGGLLVGKPLEVSPRLGVGEGGGHEFRELG